MEISIVELNQNGYYLKFKRILGIENKITQDNHTFHVQVTGNKKAKAFLDKIYENSSDNNRLDRKYSIYKTLN